MPTANQSAPLTDLGIVDIREIIRVIKNVHDLDLSNQALTSFKFRLERAMAQLKFPDAESLIRKLQDDPLFFDVFMHEISVPSTEMFRDPSLWRWLRDEYFPAAFDKAPGRFKIWLPACVSAAELFSLMILLHESGWLEKVHIIASTASAKSLELIRTGLCDLKKSEVSAENYKRFNGSADISMYLEQRGTQVTRKGQLLDLVEFRVQVPPFHQSPVNNKLILYRNQLIYYNPTYQDRILRVLYDCLSVSGCLIIGIRERINNLSGTQDFDLLNQQESVYRKKTSRLHEL